MGLAITRDFIGLHDGTISVESAGLGRGSAFTISLPLFAERDRPLARSPWREAPAIAREKASNGTRVLVVDDNVSGAAALTELLSLTGYVAHTVLTGKDACAETVSWKPHVVLLDIGLPDMDGYTVARTLRTDGFTGTIIALTGYGQEEDKRAALDAGFDFHLVKPVGIADLKSLLEKAV
jgi:CheY-like chemotaxis protein